MKKFMLGILAVIIFLAFMPLNAQMPEKKIEPVEEPKEEPKTEPLEKPDAKKYDIKSVYTKGMTFERSVVTKMSLTIEPDAGFNMDISAEFKLKNTIIDVKDGMPIEVKCEIVDAKQVGENPFSGMMPEGLEEESSSNIKSLKGHWLVAKKNSEGKFEITKKSENFPSNETLLENFKNSNSMYFDEIEFPKKGIAVGETFTFDFSKQLGEKNNPLGSMPDDIKLEEFKVKFDKIVNKDGVILGYFTGKLNQTISKDGEEGTINITTNVVHDITNNRCEKMEILLTIEGSQQQMVVKINIGVNVNNTYAKAETKDNAPKIAPKGDDE